MLNFSKRTWKLGTLYRDHYAVYDGSFVIADCLSNRDEAHLVKVAPELYALVEKLAKSLPYKHRELVQQAQELIERLQDDLEDGNANRSK